MARRPNAKSAAITAAASSHRMLARAHIPTPAARPSSIAEDPVLRRRWLARASASSPIDAIHTDTPPLSNTVKSRYDGWTARRTPTRTPAAAPIRLPRSAMRPAIPMHPSTTAVNRATSALVPSAAKRGSATNAFAAPTYGMIISGQGRPRAVIHAAGSCTNGGVPEPWSRKTADSTYNASSI
jgi:hypothetical protein